MELLKSYSNLYVEAGCDEVGRGCLCGPVVAAAVILDGNFNQNLVNDSKKLTFKTRLQLDSYIKSHCCPIKTRSQLNGFLKTS